MACLGFHMVRWHGKLIVRGQEDGKVKRNQERVRQSVNRSSNFPFH
jgi:hypothetical protein